MRVLVAYASRHGATAGIAERVADAVDEQGRDVRETTRPRECDELHDLVDPRDERVFFGPWDPDAHVGGWASGCCATCRPPRRCPGDFRGWSAIDAWAADIAGALDAAQAAP